MCDYSLHNVRSRPAKVGDKLTTRDFGTGTRGFAAPEDSSVAVCVLPGTEVSFADKITCIATGLLAWRQRVVNHTTDGQIAPLTFLCEGQQATVLQLPAEPKTVINSDAQQRVARVG
jgi:hypothetical protein